MSIRTVFLSSTGRDLAAYREAVYRAIEGLDGYHCVRMEDFGARNWAADEFCRAKVAESDLFVGIVGHLHGSCPEGIRESYTEREYEAAVSGNKPRLMFLAPEDFPLPANLIEPDEKRIRQAAFRERVNHERVRDTFKSPDELARKVIQALRNWEQETAPPRRPAKKAHRTSAAVMPTEYAEALRREIRLVSFIGPPTTDVMPPPEIETVYVPVRVETAALGRREGVEARGEDRRTTFRQAWEQWQPADHGPMVILGGPGAGKTTLLKHLGILAIEAARGGEPVPNADLSIPPGTVPVFIRLAKLGVLACGVPDLVANCPPQVDLRVPVSFFRDALKGGRCLLLLDGLDEAADRNRTAELSRWVERIHHSFPRSRIVLSSRYVAYREDAVLKVPHRCVNLVPLGSDEIPHFLRKWFTALEVTVGEDAGTRAAQLTDELVSVLSDPEREDLRVLAGTPLMLLIMALLHRSGKGLPGRRVDLYNLCVDVLLEHWNKEKGQPYISAPHGRAVLRPLAFWLHSQPGRYSATAAELAPIIGPELERTPQLPERDPLAFLNSIRDRFGLFTGQSQDEYVFLHPSFQEYLAAEHVKTEPGEAPRALAKGRRR